MARPTTGADYQATLVALLRCYLEQHDRCSSDDNPNGKRCYCDTCRQARVALKGRRGAVLADLHEVVDTLLDTYGGKK